MAIWVLIFIVCSVLAIAVLRRSSRARGARRATRHTAHKPFQSVTVKWQPQACEAVKKLNGQRFIGIDAPSFPLPDCDTEQCSCRYQFHGDRRDGERRLPHGMRHSLFLVDSSEDKRGQDDRRSNAS